MLFFCERNNRPNTMILLSAGAFIESLYLAVNMVDDYESAGYLLTHIADQKYAMDNLVMFAESIGDEDSNIASMLDDMQAIRQIYDGIESGSGAMTITTDENAAEDQPKKLVFGGSSPTTISAEDFESLKVEANRLRNKLIEG